jgi:hypothetical protein
MIIKRKISGIEATTDDLDYLWRIVNKRRPTSHAVTVNVEPLIRLLNDIATYADQFEEV